MKIRKLQRLKNYDYSQNGMYFVTICTKEKIPWLGEIIHGDINLNNYGKIVMRQLEWLIKQYPHTRLDCWVVMPDHLHLILKISSDVGTGRDLSLPLKIKSLPQLIGAFKTTSSKLIHQNGFNNFFWQRSYYDHIILNERELNKIREYIQKNPAEWESGRTDYDNLNCIL